MQLLTCGLLRTIPPLYSQESALDLVCRMTGNMATKVVVLDPSGLWRLPLGYLEQPRQMTESDRCPLRRIDVDP